MARRLALIALAALALAGCGSSPKHYYPAGFEHGFLSSCDRTSGGNTSACRCLLDYVESHENYSDALASAPDSSTDDPILQDGAKHCVGS